MVATERGGPGAMSRKCGAVLIEFAARRAVLCRTGLSAWRNSMNKTKGAEPGLFGGAIRDQELAGAVTAKGMQTEGPNGAFTGCQR